MLLKSYAKINLALNITGTREDGYHLLDMVNLPLELHDTISVDFFGEGDDTYVTCDHVELSDSSDYNICSKVVKELRKRYNFNSSVQINIHKQIPISAGMGGGSSNAATVLKYLLQTMKIKLSDQELIDLALTFGADVPFFLFNKTARVEGVGEKIKFITPKKKFYILIIKPTKGLSTKDVYKEFDINHDDKNSNIQKVISGLENGDLKAIESNIYNALEKPAIKLLPEIETIKNFIKNEGFVSQMTGSGSAIFVVSDNWFKLAKLSKKVSKLECDTFLTKIL